MKITPLAAVYEARGIALAEYSGSQTPPSQAAGMSLEPALDPWPGVGRRLYDASFRAALRVAGPEARKWLNGMITANVRDLGPGRALPSYQLDPKGHILAAFEIVCERADSFLLLASQDQLAALAERLRKFVFISKVTIEDLSETISAFLLRGAGIATDPLPASELTVEMSPSGGVEWSVGSVTGGIAQIELWTSREHAGGLWERLAPTAYPAGFATYERDRILSGIPRYGVDITATELPQETGRAAALDFTKGCYIGQEIVERIRARGAVHRQWVRIGFEAPVSVGAPLSVGVETVGKITSATHRETAPSGRWLGLGYIRRPHDAPGTAVESGGVPGQVEEFSPVLVAG